MFNKSFFSGLCFIFGTSATFANTIQILDENTLLCLDQAFNSVDLPRKQFDYPAYGVIEASRQIDEALSVVIAITSDQYARNRIKHIFEARVIERRNDGYNHIYQKAVDIYINDQGESFLNDKPLNYSISFVEYVPVETYRSIARQPEDRISLITSWVEKASQTMTLFGLHCLTGEIYEPASGEIVTPPSFDDLRTLTLN